MNFNFLSFVCYIAFQISYVTTNDPQEPTPAVTNYVFAECQIQQKIGLTNISFELCHYVQKFDEINSTIGKGIFYCKAYDQKCTFAAVLTECHRSSSGRKCQDLQPCTTKNRLKSITHIQGLIYAFLFVHEESLGARQCICYLLVLHKQYTL